MAAVFHYAHNNGNGTGGAVPLAGTASAGDILLIMTAGGADGGGLVAPVVTFGGASPTDVLIPSGNIDSGVGSEESRGILSYAVCVGGETSVTATWGSGCNWGVEVLWISGVGALNEAYIIIQGAGAFNPGNTHVEVTGGVPSSNGEIYVGFTFNGRSGYTFADMIVNGGGADNGDGFDQSGAVKGIFHHHSNSHTHLTSDNVGYGTNIMTTPYMGVIGIRVGASGPTDYTDAATVTLVGVPSGVERYTPFGSTIYDVDDTSPTAYVRAGRAGIITVVTQDHPVTFVLQTSPDGETWYNVLNDAGDTAVSIGATVGNPTTKPIKAGLFHHRLLCTAAADGPATVNITYSGGY